jgi:hypothetical protein
MYDVKFNYPSLPVEAVMLQDILADTPVKEMAALLPFPSGITGARDATAGLVWPVIFRYI